MVLLFHPMPRTGAALSGSTTGESLISGAQLMGIDVDSSEARVLRAVAACAARWGVDKTTVEDIAREAGMSRATVYRLFPGGKPAIVQQATRVEVADALVGLMAELATTASLEDWLTVAVRSGSEMLRSHPVLGFMRDHEPARLRAFLSLQRLNELFATTGQILSPSVRRFLAEPQAGTAAVWAARLVVSHYLSPTEGFDLAVEANARRLVTTYVLPGLVLDGPDAPGTRSTNTVRPDIIRPDNIVAQPGEPQP